jgi:hypothetical protein
MGGGGFAAAGWANAAYVREPQLWNTDYTRSALSSSVPSPAPGYDTDCYTVGAIQTNGGPGWANWFYIGGPGGDNTGCN